MSKPTAISRINNDNKYTFTTTILTAETIAAGAGTVSFERLNLTEAQFTALALAETQKQFYVVDKDLLDQRNQITNIITVASNTMPAGTIIRVKLYTRALGNTTPFKTIDSTLEALTAGSYVIDVIDNAELSYADWFTIEYIFAQGSEYEVTVDLVVTNKPAVLATDGGPGDGIPEVDSSSAIAAANYSSVIDFTAVFASSTTIALGSLPFTITDASQIQYVKQVNAANTLGVYQQAVNGVSFTEAAGVLTIVGAGTPFATGDVYEVGINAHKAYDPTEDVRKNVEQRPIWDRYTDVESVVSSPQALTTSPADFGSEQDTRGYKKAFFWVSVTIGGDTGIRFKIMGKNESAGAEEFPLSDASVTVHTANTYAAAAASRYFELTDNATQLVCVEVSVNNAIPFLQFQAFSGTHSAGTLALIKITKGY